MVGDNQVVNLGPGGGWMVESVMTRWRMAVVVSGDINNLPQTVHKF